MFGPFLDLFDHFWSKKFGPFLDPFDIFLDPCQKSERQPLNPKKARTTQKMADTDKHSCDAGKENIEKLPQVGEHYLVKRSDNTLHAAEIIQTRQNEGGYPELYVHYEGYDRRLDEWVELDR